MIIHPEIIVTPDTPTVRFREAKDQFDLDKELPKVLVRQGWGCGTYFHVQFISFDKTKLLSTALFVVTEEDEQLIVNDDNPYKEMTKTVFNRKAARVSKWWYSEAELMRLQEEKEAPPPEPPEAKLGYDQKAKEHLVTLDGEEIFRNAYKGKCQEFIREQRA